MIRLTRLSGSPFVLNSDLIERIDETPDTVITLGDGTNYVAAESAATVVAAIRMHRAQIIALSETVRISLQTDQLETRELPGLASVTEIASVAHSAAHQQGIDH